jgi:uncharacterized membrane protein
MGTCGLVGPIGVVTGWLSRPETSAARGGSTFDWIGLILTAFVIPAVFTLLASEIMRKKGYIAYGDLKIDC